MTKETQMQKTPKKTESSPEIVVTLFLGRVMLARQQMLDGRGRAERPRGELTGLTRGERAFARTR